MSEYKWSAVYPEDIQWDAQIPASPITSVIDDSISRFPNNPCIDFLGNKYTYSALGKLIDQAAQGFQSLGVEKGTRVGLFLPNTPHFVISYFGVLRAGGIVVSYSPLYAEDQLRHQIEDSGTEVMVTLDLDVLYSKIRPLVNGSPLKTLIIGTMQEVLPFPKNILFPLLKRKDIAKTGGGSDELAYKDFLNKKKKTI